MKRNEVKNYDSIDSLKTRKTALRKYMSPDINSNIEIDSILGLKGDEKILDVGCGFGDLLFYIRNKYSNTTLYGVDISSTMIKEAMSKSKNINYSLQNAEKLKFKDEEMNIVVAKHMLYHVNNIEKAINEAYRVLKPNGLFLITLHSRKNSSRDNIERYKDFLAKELGAKKSETINRINAETYIKYLKPGNFEIIKELKLFSIAHINNVNPFIEYMSTFKEFYTPTPTPDKWSKALDKLRIKIQKEIEAHGYIREVYGMGILLMQKVYGR